MIDVHELRIGNLICWNPRLTQPQTTLLPVPVEVTAVLGDRVGYVAPNMEHRVEPFEDDLIQLEPTFKGVEELEPLPLAAIRPGKLGLAGSMHLTVEEDGGFMLTPGQAAPPIRFPDASLRYVHQLQNLYFALTGEEMELNSLSFGQ